MVQIALWVIEIWRSKHDINFPLYQLKKNKGLFYSANKKLGSIYTFKQLKFKFNYCTDFKQLKFTLGSIEV